MIQFNFSFDNSRSIYVQLAEQLELYIVSGRIPPGAKLPPVRELANLAKVNPNTMQRALIELENSGLIYTERTNGKYATTDLRLIEDYRSKYIYHRLHKVFEDLEAIGFSKRDIIKIVRNLEDKNDHPRM